MGNSYRFPEKVKNLDSWASNDIKSFTVSNNNRDDDYRESSNISIKIDLGLMKIIFTKFSFTLEDSKKKDFYNWKKVHIFSQIRESYKIIDVITDAETFLFCPVIGFKNSMSSVYIIDSDLDANLDDVETRSNMVIRSTMSEGNIGYARSIRTNISSVKKALSQINTPLINPIIAVNSKTHVSKVICESGMMKKARTIMVVEPDNNELLSIINKKDFPNHIELDKIHLYSKINLKFQRIFKNLSNYICFYYVKHKSILFFKDVLMYLRNKVLKNLFKGI